MTAHAVYRAAKRRRAGSIPVLPFALLMAIILSGAAFVSYVLWPTWSGATLGIDAPAIPVTVAGVLFEVPPAAVRTAVQRHPGPHERIDLAFLWPSLLPPQPNVTTDASTDTKTDPQSLAALDRDDAETTASVPAKSGGRLFVTIAAIGTLLPPVERMRSIYPRYLEAQATPAADGLAILPFRTGTPYEGEDLIYLAADPAQFFARCTRQVGVVPGTCIHERALDAAEVTLRFPRDWLDDWRSVAAGFDRLTAQLHPGINNH